MDPDEPFSGDWDQGRDSDADNNDNDFDDTTDPQQANEFGITALDPSLQPQAGTQGQDAGEDVDDNAGLQQITQPAYTHAQNIQGRWPYQQQAVAYNQSLMSVTSNPAHDQDNAMVPAQVPSNSASNNVTNQPDANTSLQDLQGSQNPTQQSGLPVTQAVTHNQGQQQASQIQPDDGNSANQLTDEDHALVAAGPDLLQQMIDFDLANPDLFNQTVQDVLQQQGLAQQQYRQLPLPQQQEPSLPASQIHQQPSQQQAAPPPFHIHQQPSQQWQESQPQSKLQQQAAVPLSQLHQQQHNRQLPQQESLLPPSQLHQQEQYGQRLLYKAAFPPSSQIHQQPQQRAALRPFQPYQRQHGQLQQQEALLPVAQQNVLLQTQQQGQPWQQHQAPLPSGPQRRIPQQRQYFHPYRRDQQPGSHQYPSSHPQISRGQPSSQQTAHHYQWHQQQQPSQSLQYERRSQDPNRQPYARPQDQPRFRTSHQPHLQSQPQPQNISYPQPQHQPAAHRQWFYQQQNPQSYHQVQRQQPSHYPQILQQQPQQQRYDPRQYERLSRQRQTFLPAQDVRSHFTTVATANRNQQPAEDTNNSSELPEVTTSDDDVDDDDEDAKKAAKRRQLRSTPPKSASPNPRLYNKASQRASRSHFWPRRSDLIPRMGPRPQQFENYDLGGTGGHLGEESGRNLVAYYDNETTARTRYNITITRGRGRTSRDERMLPALANYPAPTVPIAGGTTLAEICARRPRHVWGSGLRLFMAEGWPADKIWKLLPDDMRLKGNPDRPWNYIQKAMERECEKICREEGRPVSTNTKKPTRRAKKIQKRRTRQTKKDDTPNSEDTGDDKSSEKEAPSDEPSTSPKPAQAPAPTSRMTVHLGPSTASAPTNVTHETVMLQRRQQRLLAVLTQDQARGTSLETQLRQMTSRHFIGIGTSQRRQLAERYQAGRIQRYRDGLRQRYGLQQIPLDRAMDLYRMIHRVHHGVRWTPQTDPARRAVMVMEEENDALRQIVDEQRNLNTFLERQIARVTGPSSQVPTSAPSGRGQP